MKWYKKIFIKYQKEAVSSAIFFIIFSLMLLFWYFFLGKSFLWRNIEPISAPNFFERAFYSALVFISVGALLYFIRFYQFLHFLIINLTGNWRWYKGIKSILWGCLILVMYFWIIPRIVDLLNYVISFFYNIFGLILYAIPPLGISLVIFIPLLVFIKKYKLKNNAISS